METNVHELPDWKLFEVAVADFLRALDPNAKVIHDAHIPDAHTGKPRQRDVWIESTIGKLFRIKILVSCKFWNSKLSEQEIDHFNGEFISSGANKGVIYSKAGFGDDAIAKAKRIGFDCCRLYDNQPPDIPEAIVITVHLTKNDLSISLNERVDPALTLKKWGDLLSMTVTHDGKQSQVIDVLSEVHDTAMKQAQSQINPKKAFPPQWQRHLQLASVEQAGRPVSISLFGRWKTWQAKQEAFLVHGTYSMTDGSFIGTQMPPAIDLKGREPGPGWTLTDPPPEKVPTGHVHIVCTANVRENLLQQLSHVSIVD